MNLQQFFNSKGYDISEKIYWDPYLYLWNSWYRGKVRDFHTYFVYNGQYKVRREKKSLQGAKKTCEDWADLLFNEKVRISLKAQDSTKKLENIFERNNATVLINQGVEKSFSLGIGALVVSVQNMSFIEEKNILDITNAKISLEFINGQAIYPLSWQGGEIKECAFVSYKTINKKTYMYVSMHIIDELGNYVIENYKFECSGRNKSILSSFINDSDNFLEKFDTHSNIPWFSIIKPNLANNIDENTPFGISIFANAIDVLKSLDNSYNELDNELILGRRRTFVSEQMMTYDNGVEQMTFDPEDISIYRMPKNFNKDGMINHDSTELRTDKIQSAVQFNLNMLSAKVGFGNDRYKFDGNTIQTATGVISENSDMFRTLKKHEQVLESSLKTIITAVAYASSTFTKEKIDASEITIDFDDSIIEDKGAQRVSAQQEVTAGLRSKLDYLQNIRGFGKEQAEQELQRIQDEKISNQEAFGFLDTNNAINTEEKENDNDNKEEEE